MTYTYIVIGRFRVRLFSSQARDPVTLLEHQNRARRIIGRWAASGGYDHKDDVEVIPA